MTEHVVLSRATAYRAELERKEHVALLSLSTVRSERARVEQFLELYARFNAAPEPEAEHEAFVLTPEGWKHAEESQSPIQEPEAPKPLPDVADDFAAALLRPAEAKTFEQEALSNASGGMQDECYDPSPRPNSSDDIVTEGSGNVFVDLGFTEEQGREIVAAHAAPEDLHAQAAVEGVQKEAHEHNQEYNSAPAVAEQMAQIRAAVEGPKKNVGGRPTNSKLRERILAFKAENPFAPVRDAAKALGVGSGSISVAAKALGISFPRAPMPSKHSPSSDKLRAAINTHPEWTAKQLAEDLGMTTHAVNALAKYAGLTIRRLSAEELSAAKRAGAAKTLSVRRSAQAEKASVERLEPTPALAPKPQPVASVSSGAAVSAEEVEALPAAVVKELSKPAQRLKTEPVASKVPSKVAPKVEEPLAFAGEQDEAEADYVAPPLSNPTWQATPNTKWFRLRRADGLWLHMSGHGFTTDKNMGWIGRIGQLRTARARFDDAQGLQIVGVSAVAK